MEHKICSGVFRMHMSVMGRCLHSFLHIMYLSLQWRCVGVLFRIINPKKRFELYFLMPNWLMMLLQPIDLYSQLLSCVLWCFSTLRRWITRFMILNHCIITSVWADLRHNWVICSKRADVWIISSSLNPGFIWGFFQSWDFTPHSLLTCSS